MTDKTICLVENSKKFIKKDHSDQRKCDGCGKHSLELEQNTCVTAHIEENQFPFIKHTCFSDSFYCSSCLNENGFCDSCSENVSVENQKALTI